jgi:hypothetical protein
MYLYSHLSHVQQRKAIIQFLKTLNNKQCGNESLLLLLMLPFFYGMQRRHRLGKFNLQGVFYRTIGKVCSRHVASTAETNAFAVQRDRIKSKLPKKSIRSDTHVYNTLMLNLESLPCGVSLYVSRSFSLFAVYLKIEIALKYHSRTPSCCCRSMSADQKGAKTACKNILTSPMNFRCSHSLRRAKEFQLDI